MQVTRLKFKCTNNSTGEYGHQIFMEPVYCGSKENESFWEATPGGAIQFTTTNAHAAMMFEAGKEYYVDIQPAPEQSE